jgi:hypothetical protein
MKSVTNHLLTLALLLTMLMSSCTPESTPNNPTPSNHCKNYFENITIVGGGIDNYNSWRNNHYKITIANDKTTISIKADFKGVNGRIYLLNSAGDYLTYSDIGTSVALEDFVVNKAGTYYIILNSEDVGTYSLDICGDVATVEVLKSTKISFDNQNMAVGGGTDSYNSWRNKHFSFEVPEDNTFIDFLVKSKVTNCRIYIINSAGDYLTYSDIGTYTKVSPFNFKKGTYYIVVNGEEDKATTFDLTVYSKAASIINAKNISSTNFSKKTGSFNPGGGVDNYSSLLSRKFTFSVSTLTHIDLIANSSGLNTRLYLLNSTGNYITYSDVGTYNRIESHKLTKGTYTVAVNGDEDKNGTFDLILHSQEGTVTDLVPK